MMTEETALRIVKQAEQEYDPENRRGLTSLVGWITGWSYGKDRDDDDGRNSWQDYHEGACAMMHRSSEQIAKTLARQINDVAELLHLVREKSI